MNYIKFVFCNANYNDYIYIFIKYYSPYKMRLFNILVFFQAVLVGFAQEHPPVMAFPPELYGAANQNWSITQTEDQKMYFANNSGLLEFNGSEWTLHPVSDNSIVRSVQADGQRVYTGSYMDFGYWEHDQFGALKYQSLVKTYKLSILEEEQFWNIKILDDWILFQSLSRIYMINSVSNQTRTIESDHEIWNIFNVDGIIYFAKKNNGIYKIVNGTEVLVTRHPKLISSRLVGISSIDNNLLFITANQGFYFIDNGTIKPWKLNLDVSDLTIYSANQLKDGSLVLGTISKKLDYLVTGNSKPTKKKVENAKQLKIKIIKEIDWYKMLNL